MKTIKKLTLMLTLAFAAQPMIANENSSQKTWKTDLLHMPLGCLRCLAIGYVLNKLRPHLSPKKLNYIAALSKYLTINTQSQHHAVSGFVIFHQ